MIHPSGNGQESTYVDHANFIFKLNCLQVIIAADEFKKKVAELRKSLHVLHDHIIKVTRLEFNVNDYFKHFTKIEEQLILLINQCDAITLERAIESPLNPEVIQQGMKLAGLYTMDSERLVLYWLLNNLNGQPEEMKQTYMIETFNQDGPEIELFLEMD